MEPLALGQRAEAQLVNRYFTQAGVDPFDTVEWVTRDAWPTTPQYFKAGIEVPEGWSQNALDIVSKLYLADADDYVERSIRQLIERVMSKYAVEALRFGYFGVMPLDCEVTEGKYRSMERFSDPGERRKYVSWLRGEQPDHPAIAFYDELCYIALYQMAAFNSPVWFNVGRPDRPQQVSACFVLSVDDNTTSIMETGKREAFIFKGGSGSGFDVSRIRGSMEPLSTGGTASGPVSFMRMWDAGAGTFKSGGTTRRAAKLVKLDVDHPDVVDFVECKVREERRLRVLADAGLDIGFSEAAERDLAEVTSFQNANNSVGVTDEFMRRATDDMFVDEWPLQARATDDVVDVVSAPELLDKIAEAAWACADPGMLFMDAINSMHTTPVLDGAPSPIRSSNPCGEFLSNDDTSCNLASTNVLKFVGDDGAFDVRAYRQVVDVMILAMDVGISFADFPDAIIGERTRDLRQLGLGYSNMGAAIMVQGMPYDSDQAREFAAAVTALNTGRAYRQSALLARCVGTFRHFSENRDAMIDVIDQHVSQVPDRGVIGEDNDEIWLAAEQDWSEAAGLGQEYGYRNAQASVLAPAGSISYLMDCDTTGIEPAFELVSYKDLAGGGSMVLASRSVERALRRLGYADQEIAKMERSVRDAGAPPFTEMTLPDHRAVFHGANEISWQGHVKMVAAVQPFVSGGISKTINMPEAATVKDVRDAYELAWRSGIKDIALYRNNCKVRQVLMSKSKDDQEAAVLTLETSRAMDDEARSLERAAAEPYRRRMPRTRRSLTHKIHVRSAMGEHEGYVMAGVHDDGALGEVFIEGFGKQGSFTQNALAAWATDFSIALQYGVPMDVLCAKHAYVSDETGGVVVPDPEGGQLVLRECKSIVDYIARWLVAEFGTVDLQEELGVMTDAVKARKVELLSATAIIDKIDAEVRDDGTELVKDAEIVGVALRSEPWINGMNKIVSNGHARSVDMGPPCSQCGGTMHRAGACWQCRCGNSTGCG